MIPPRPLLSRRTTLATGLGAAGLAAITGAGCSVQAPGGDSPASTPRQTHGGLEPDVQVVVDLVDGFRRSVALVHGTRARHPKLAALLAPLLALQKEHLAVLQKAAPQGSVPRGVVPALTVPGVTSKALDDVLERAEVLKQQCFSGAGRAESGAFARLLASMGAALSQRLVVVRTEATAKAPQS